MKTRMLCLALMSVLTLLSSRPLFAQVGQATSKPVAEAPWSKEVDGLVCRLIVPGEVSLTEPMTVTLEVKNVSNRMRYLIDMPKVIQKDHYMNNQCAELYCTGPDGKEYRPGVHAGYLIVPDMFIPIQPGEVKRAPFEILTSQGGSGMLSSAGEWKLKFALTSPKPARAVVKNIGKVVNGQLIAEPVYGDPTQEQVDNAWVGAIEAEAPINLSGAPPKLTVHEWGVFCGFADAQYANANLKEEWASMPEGFYRQFPEHRLRGVDSEAPPAFVEKPIIYFYTGRQNLALEVKLAFAAGAPVVWWPCATSPVDQTPPKPGDVFRALEWSGKLTADPARAPGIVSLPPDSWVQKARIDGPALFVTNDAPKKVGAALGPPVPGRGGGMRRGYRMQSEKFIYYDGLTPAVDFIRCDDASAGTITVQNTAKFDIANLILVDRRDEKSFRYARVDKLAAGAKVKVALKAITDDEFKQPAQVLRTDLRAAGLFDKEADSVLEIWRKGLFDRPGITALYLLPQAEYDRMLPLTVTPKPQSTVRVGIALQGQIEMASAKINACVKDLVAKMDDDKYRVRDQAEKDLSDLGPAAFAAIRAALAGNVSAEARTRLEKLLARDASQYLGKSGD